MNTLISRIPSFFKSNFFIILVLYILAVSIRLYTISNNNVLFFYDQARDAHISRQILDQKDIKIIGPSASGTEDQLYHGVFYYYVVGPIYSLTQGNPHAAASSLAYVNSLTVIPLFYLALAISKRKKVASLATILFVFSSQSALLNTWLSNPSLALLTITSFYLFFWNVVFQKKYIQLPLLALFLGLSNQAVLFSIYLFLAIGLAIFYLWQQNELKKISTKTIAASVFVYLMTVSTMILTELMMFQKGILSFGKFGQISTVQEDPFQAVLKILGTYTSTFAWGLIPLFLTISAIIASVVLYLFYKDSEQKVKIFISIWISSPLLLLIFQSRSDSHTLVGLTPVIYIVVALVLHRIKSNSKAILATIIFFFVLFNYLQIDRIKDTRKNTFSVQQGAFLRDEIAAIDYIYQSAQGRQFSISSFTNPYGYNTTWAYLFDWYGQKNYGYKPLFFGPNQAGIIGDTLLMQSQTPLPLHYVIYEPLEGLSEGLQKTFTLDQDLNSGLVSEQRKFGAIRIEQRITPIN